MMAERSKAAKMRLGSLIGRIVGVHIFSLNAEWAGSTGKGILALLDRAEEVDVFVRKHQAVAKPTGNVQHLLVLFPLEANRS